MNSLVPFRNILTKRRREWSEIVAVCRLHPEAYHETLLRLHLEGHVLAAYLLRARVDDRHVGPDEVVSAILGTIEDDVYRFMLYKLNRLAEKSKRRHHRYLYLIICRLVRRFGSTFLEMIRPLAWYFADVADGLAAFVVDQRLPHH